MLFMSKEATSHKRKKVTETLPDIDPSPLKVDDDVDGDSGVV